MAKDVPQSIKPLLAQKRILITVGSGGVGKTTMAASMGLAAASEGLRTLVLTIDPARRLATALGLDRLGNTARQIAPQRLQEAGVEGELWAMTLETKQTFDEMVRRYAPDEEAAERLLKSPIYCQFSTRLAGAQEYAAMEKLHELYREEGYDLLVLDTPPAANAFDFLDAPQKMVEAVQSPAVDLLVRSHRQGGGLSWGMLGFGAAYVLRRLARFTGGGFLDDIARFLSDLSGHLEGMKERASKVQELLSSDEVGYIVVTAPDPRSMAEAQQFMERLQLTMVKPSAVVLNRVHPPPVEVDQEELQRELEGLGARESVQLARVLIEAGSCMGAMARWERDQIEQLQRRWQLPVAKVPVFEADVHDIGGLVRVMRQIETVAQNPRPTLK